MTEAQDRGLEAGDPVVDGAQDILTFINLDRDVAIRIYKDTLEMSKAERD